MNCHDSINTTANNNRLVYDNDNIFAKILQQQIPNHTVYEDDKTLAFMDVMPQATGHVLVIAKYPAVELTDMPDEYLLAVFNTAKKVINAQRRLFGQDVVQLQLNGKKAGQSVFHYHVHLIPSHVQQLGQHQSHQANHQELATLAKQLYDLIQQDLTN